jgi:gamma-glutamyltranspeptidase/glutathione hydrolase
VSLRAAASTASSPAARAAAAEILAAGGTAVDAVIAGFFAAAGERPNVLLAPAVALVGGTGAGGRAYDGRSAQPGLGAPRPRGFVEGATIPDAAYVSAPRTIAMLMLLHGHRGRTSLSVLARPGVSAADAQDEKSRAGLIRRVGASGVLALRSSEVARALITAGGAVAGGMLTERDLDEARPAEADAVTTTLPSGAGVLTSPWPAPDAAASGTEAVVACDGRGIVAAIAYAPTSAGVLVPELGITLARDAIPVLRGVTRLAPGTPLAAPAPIALLGRKGFWAALGVTGVATLRPEALEALASGQALESALAALRAHEAARVALAATSDGNLGRSAISEG